MTRRRRLEPLDALPDVRDGLNRLERVVLTVLNELQRERQGRDVPVAQLYGRVLEHVDLSEAELQRVLQRLGAGPHVSPSPRNRGGGQGEGSATCGPTQPCSPRKPT